MALSLFPLIVLVFIMLATPPCVIDIALTIAYFSSLILLMVTICFPHLLAFFPPLFFIITLYRLALAIFTTSLILVHGQDGIIAAGQFVAALGSVVCGGGNNVGLASLVIGGIIFTSFLIIYTKVTGKCTTRVSEITLFFNFGSIPGKQMAIDADLHSGIIDEEEAIRRRSEIQKCTDFCNAMEGAAKFAQMEVFANISITVINITVGILVGVFVHDMDFVSAARVFTILTIGSGLMVQISALITAINSNFLITRVTGYIELSAESGERFLGRSNIDPLELEVGYHVVPLMAPQQSGGKGVPARIPQLRRQLALELGITFPIVRIRDNIQLGANEYVIKIYGNPVASGMAQLGKFMAIDYGAAREKLDGDSIVEPVFGLSALWIQPSRCDYAQRVGWVVIDAETVITTHLKEVIQDHADIVLLHQ